MSDLYYTVSNFFNKRPVIYKAFKTTVIFMFVTIAALVTIGVVFTTSGYLVSLFFPSVVAILVASFLTIFVIFFMFILLSEIYL